MQAGLPTAFESLRCNTLPALAFVSLALPDSADRILSARHEGASVLSIATSAQTVQRRAALALGTTEFLQSGPIDPEQLSARIEFLVTGSALPALLELDIERGQVTVDDTVHPVSERETALFQVLLAAKGGFVKHEALLAAVWQGRYDDRQHLRVAINRLRRRIEPEPDMPRYLLSEPAIGYRIGRPR